MTCGGLTPRDSSTDCLHCDAPLPRPPRWVLRLTALLGPAGAILLAACYGAPGRYYTKHDPNGPDGASRFDRDRDGAYGPYECDPYGVGIYERCIEQLARMPPPAQLDCDDLDARRFPGAPDLDGDRIDANCDGLDGRRDPAIAVDPDDEPAHVAIPPAP